MAKKDKFCPHCGHIGKPKVGGSLFITLILLLLWVIPGLIYEIWRTSEKQLVCEECRHKGLIPASSPVAQRHIRENKTI